MKRKFLALTLIMVLVGLVFGCATLKEMWTGIDSPTKKFILVQEEVNVALYEYAIYLNSQDEATQADLHFKFDELIIALDAAMDAWKEVIDGITLDTGQLQKFMEIKNRLILAGWTFFSEDKLDEILGE